MADFTGSLPTARRDTAMLFNDRFGLQRLYYHEAKDAFYFAAEAKGDPQGPAGVALHRPARIGEFVACGCVLENRTLFPAFTSFRRVSPGSFVTERWKEKATYFEPREWEEQEPLEPEEYYAQLRDTFVQELAPLFQRAGARGSLTHRRSRHAHHHGLAQGEARTRLPCYTFGSMYRDNQDVGWRARWQKSAASHTRLSLPARSFSHSSRITPSDRLTSPTPASISAARRIST